jgi:hypothetical protein
LERLVVLIEDLEIGYRRRGLVLSEVYSGEISEGAASKEEEESEGSGESGTKLPAGIEEQAGARALEPACRRLGLLLAKKDGEPLVKVGRGFRSLPCIKERHRSLKRLKLAAALRAGAEVVSRGGVRWSSRIEQKIRKSGLAITADHDETFPFLC